MGCMSEMWIDRRTAAMQEQAETFGMGYGDDLPESPATDRPMETMLVVRRDIVTGRPVAKHHIESAPISAVRSMILGFCPRDLYQVWTADMSELLTVVAF